MLSCSFLFVLGIFLAFSQKVFELPPLSKGSRIREGRGRWEEEGREWGDKRGGGGEEDEDVIPLVYMEEEGEEDDDDEEGEDIYGRSWSRV